MSDDSVSYIEVTLDMSKGNVFATGMDVSTDIHRGACDFDEDETTKKCRKMADDYLHDPRNEKNLLAWLLPAVKKDKLAGYANVTSSFGS